MRSVNPQVNAVLLSHQQWVDAVGKQSAFDEDVTVHNSIIRKCLVQGDY